MTPKTIKKILSFTQLQFEEYIKSEFIKNQQVNKTHGDVLKTHFIIPNGTKMFLNFNTTDLFDCLYDEDPLFIKYKQKLIKFNNTIVTIMCENDTSRADTKIYSYYDIMLKDKSIIKQVSANKLNLIQNIKDENEIAEILSINRNEIVPKPKNIFSLNEITEALHELRNDNKIKIKALWKDNSTIGNKHKINGYIGIIYLNGYAEILCTLDSWNNGENDSLRKGWNNNIKIFTKYKSVPSFSKNYVNSIKPFKNYFNNYINIPNQLKHLILKNH